MQLTNFFSQNYENSCYKKNYHRETEHLQQIEIQPLHPTITAEKENIEPYEYPYRPTSYSPDDSFDCKMTSGPNNIDSDTEQEEEIEENINNINKGDCNDVKMNDNRPGLQLTEEEITKLLEASDGDENGNEFLNELYVEEKRLKSNEWFDEKMADEEYFISSRSCAVECIRNVGYKLRLKSKTCGLAILYFDKLHSCSKIANKWCQFIACICLWIASKFNETFENCPTLNDIILNYKKNESFITFDMQSFENSEMRIFKTLDFRLKAVLPIDFIEIFLSKGILFNDDYIISRKDNKTKHKICKTKFEKDVIKYTQFFIEMSHENYNLINKYKPSTMAIAIICATRRSLNVYPYFNKNLLKIFGINEITQEIDECFNDLWKRYKSNFQREANVSENTQQPGSLLHF